MGRIVEDKKKTSHGLICCAIATVLFVSPVSALSSVKVDKISEQAAKPPLDCRIDYPHISGVTDESVQERLNVRFAEQAKIFCTKAEYEAKSGTVRANMGYRVTRNKDGVMSLVICECMNSGNGDTVTQTGVTIDTVTGQRYFISDLFIDNADYVSTLSEKVKLQIERKRLDTKQVKAFYKISENANYYLTADTLVLFFRQGEYFSNECSVKEFAIPLKTLEEILKPQFVVNA